MIDFIDKTSEQSGTPLNRENLMAIQGFESLITEPLPNGDVLQTNSKGQTLLIHRNDDGSITQTFTGEKTITKTISVIEGKIVEVIS